MTLGRPIYYINCCNCLSSPDSLFLRLLCLSGREMSIVRMMGVEKVGVDWTSGEVSDLVEPPSNLVLYMYLRIFTYT